MKEPSGGIRWGRFQTETLLKILKIYEWGDTVGLFLNFINLQKSGKYTGGGVIVGIYVGGCGGVRWGSTVGEYCGGVRNTVSLLASFF